MESACRPVRTVEAREAASDFLARLNPPPPEPTVQKVVLLVSERVNNALRHVGAVTSMELRANRHRIQVIVEDPSPAHPQDRTPDLTGRTGGFGWPVIQRLAHDVTIARDRTGPAQAKRSPPPCPAEAGQPPVHLRQSELGEHWPAGGSSPTAALCGASGQSRRRGRARSAASRPARSHRVVTGPKAGSPGGVGYGSDSGDAASTVWAGTHRSYGVL